jgi:acyl dehydratase
MPFLRPISDRYFEDYLEGEVHRFGTIAVGADEIVAFAEQFGPQAIHIDPEAAKNGPFGGLIASGWHTAGLMTRLFMEHYLTKVASLISPRWRAWALPAAMSYAGSSRCAQATLCQCA